MFPPGTALSHFTILRRIGEGGMGDVYLARDETLRRDVAIKICKATIHDSERARARFRREALALSRLSHPRIATVFELLSLSELDVLVMEYVPGETVAARIAHGPLPVDDAIEWSIQMAEALSHAHARHVVHRDLKPSNVVCVNDRHIKLIDFGIAGLLADSASSTDTTIAAVDEGAAMGTLPYMAPEQLRCEKTDHRADLYSLGVCLYEMVAGRRPFDAGTRAELVALITAGNAAFPSRKRPGLSPALDSIIARAMDTRPALRYQNAAEVIAALETLRSPRAPRRVGVLQNRRRIPWRVALAVAGALAVGLAAFLLGNERGWWPAATRDQTILVLPLPVEGADGADGSTRPEVAIAANLAQARGLSVLPPPDADEMSRYSSTRRRREALRRHAGLMIDGKVVRGPLGYRAEVILEDTRRNRVVWGSAVSANYASIDRLCAAVALDVARALERPLPSTASFTRVARTLADVAPEDVAQVVTAYRRADVASAMSASARLLQRFPQDSDALKYRYFILSWASDRSDSGAGASALRREAEAVSGRLRDVDSNDPWKDWTRMLGPGPQRDEGASHVVP